jgi:hypothetical protein
MAYLNSSTPFRSRLLAILVRAQVSGQIEERLALELALLPA